VDDFLTAKTKEERAALKRNPRVLAIIAELQAATVSNGVDTDGLLEELGAAEMEPPATTEQGAVIITPQLAMPKRSRSKKPVAA
jgi:hypothetical protein